MEDKKHVRKKYGGKVKIVKRKDRRLQELKEIKEKTELCNEQIDPSAIHSFSDFPISERTLQGLSESGFIKPTEIQKDGITLALRGLDVLGAAKTGSGKTLAFLIPVLELLWRNMWAQENGLGALIISPTRELALQTYEVLRKIGKKHDFSAGLIIGGKDIDEEKNRIQNTNIIICTPGRLLQHFDETPNFRCDDLKIIVLDEADRILDLGFSNTMNAIIENLNEDRQSLLFSATQTKSVKDLARLSLKNPEYIAVHEKSKYTTPKKLTQSYVIVDLNQKINFLFSFVKNHLKSKSIVFLSSCKQVKFMYEIFRKIRPGVPLMALYGKQKQLKRVAIYNRFCNTNNAMLFATDIAARGLDFPAVNWVVQFDCPENVDTYIHRAGRTARFEKGGQALLMLLPSEFNMVNKLLDRKVPIHEIKANPKKLRSIQGKLQAFCAQDQDIKYWAQRSIISYARSVYLQTDKDVFDVVKLPIEEFATSCGLLVAPKIRFMKTITKKIGPTSNVQSKLSMNKNDEKLGIELLANSDVDDGDDEEENVIEKKSFMLDDGSDDDDDDILVKKSTNCHHDKMDEMPEAIYAKKSPKRKGSSKAALAKKLIRKNIKVNTKINFDEHGKVVDDSGGDAEVDEYNIASSEGGIDVEKAKMRMKDRDKIDREKERKRIKEKHRQQKRKMKEERKMDSEGVSEVVLDSTNENNQDQEEEEEEPRRAPRNKKRKMADRSDDVIPLLHHVTNATLLEDEELALHLLAAS